MLDDIKPPKPRQRRKPPRIEPLKATPQTSIHELATAEDPAFDTPEQVAGRDEPITEPTVSLNHAKKTKWYQLQRPFTNRQKIIGSLLVVLLFFAIGAGWALTHHRREATANGVPTKVKAAPATIYSKLSGLPVADASVNKRPVTAVMVENSVDARPQSGLSQAGVVFEAVAEGGVTRFMALYQDQMPTNVGPIRSARPYYIQWALGFDAGYAHVGGSQDGLQDIKNWHVRDLDQFANAGAYHRISSRAAPHNVYTGIDTLEQLSVSKGYTTSDYSGFKRKKEQPYKAPAPQSSQTKATDTRTPATSVDFSLSGYTYDPHYDYDASTNSYKRTEAGKAQTDANTGAQLNPKVVIAIAVPLARGALDASGAYYSDYNPIGSGQAWVFQDGTATKGTWSKSGNTEQITFTDSTGKQLALDPGQTWISAVSDAGKVSYK